MTDIKLTDTQHKILNHAVQHTGGKLGWFPDNIKGGARNRVIDALFNRALITRDGECWCVAAEGYDALGVARPGCEPTQPTEPEQRHSKQAQIISLLQRPEGATISQMCAATGWQQHTVRGTLAGTLKKKLGLTIDSSKESGGERIYHIVG